MFKFLSSPFSYLLLCHFAFGAIPNYSSSSDTQVFHFAASEQGKIKKRYHKKIENLFDEQQLQLINNQNKHDIIKKLLLHEYIIFNEPQLVIDFADSIQGSGFSFIRLEKHLINYLKNGLTPFKALDKAINKLKNEEWTRKQHYNVNTGHTLLKNINELNLSLDDHDKIVHVYAVCINSWRDPENRQGRLKPKICEPVKHYKKPRHDKHAPKVRQSFSHNASKKSHAYNYLVQEAWSVAQDFGLSSAEKVVMIKCVAEKSLKFFEPLHSPLKSLSKIHKARTRSVENEFFSHSGVCLNFAGIAYNLGEKLGLENSIHLADRHLHSYLEVEIDGEWYHSHPFNSNHKSCDLTRFGTID
ncbi:MAG: hypothetical protein H6731_09885 [Myxococcales bacterium]|nr:MAG: hypothetical protein H6731_09885 [Myxococcales bacterium]